MRYVYFLLLVLMVSSCAQGKLRLRKVNKEDRQELVESSAKKERSFAFNQDQTIIEPSSSIEGTEEIAANVEEEFENETIVSADAMENNSTEVNELTTEEIEDDPSKKQKVRQALIAERDARKAKNSFIWSLSMFAMFLVPFLSIIGLFSFIPFIIGTIRLRKSNNSDYITLEGERDAGAARIMQVIYGVLFALSVIAVATLLILIFL